jgi:hypothetical protein
VGVCLLFKSSVFVCELWLCWCCCVVWCGVLLFGVLILSFKVFESGLTGFFSNFFVFFCWVWCVGLLGFGVCVVFVCCVWCCWCFVFLCLCFVLGLGGEV